MSEIQIHQEDYSTVNCPVGRELLMLRKPWEIVEVYCTDCNRTYKFDQYSSKPVSSFYGRHNDSICECAACRGQRDD